MDIEAFGFIQSKLAAMRGLISGVTYEKIQSALNAAKQENFSLKSENGRLMAELDSARAEIDALRTANSRLQNELESLSIKSVDAAVEKLVGAVEDKEIIRTLETENVAESVPGNSLES